MCQEALSSYHQPVYFSNNGPDRRAQVRAKVRRFFKKTRLLHNQEKSPLNHPPLPHTHVAFITNRIEWFRAALSTLPVCSSQFTRGTNMVTGGEQPVTRARLPPSAGHAVLSITTRRFALPSHLDRTVGSLFRPGPRWVFKSQMSEARLQPDT